MRCEAVHCQEGKSSFQIWSQRADQWETNRSQDFLPYTNNFTQTDNNKTTTKRDNKIFCLKQITTEQQLLPFRSGICCCDPYPSGRSGLLLDASLLRTGFIWLICSWLHTIPSTDPDAFRWCYKPPIVEKNSLCNSRRMTSSRYMILACCPECLLIRFTGTK